MRQGGATVCFLLPFQTPALHLGSARCVAQKPNGELERRWSSLRLRSARGSYWCRPVNPQQSPSPRGEGLPGRLQLECILMACGCPITILFASFSRSTLWRCPFADNRVTACQRTWFPGLLAVCGVFFLFCFVCLIVQEGRDISVSGSVSVRDKAEWTRLDVWMTDPWVTPLGSSWSDWFEVESSPGHTENGCHWAFLSSLFIYFSLPFP